MAQEHRRKRCGKEGVPRNPDTQKTASRVESLSTRARDEHSGCASDGAAAAAHPASVSAAHSVQDVMLGKPVMHHAFAMMLAPIGARLEHRQRDEHEQPYGESNQTCDRFGIHGGLLRRKDPAYIVEQALQDRAMRWISRFGGAHCALRLDSWPATSSVDAHSSSEKFMKRFLLAASLFSLFALSACADAQAVHHHAPPKDPADYHGVPTDDRPPSMIDAPVAPK